MAAGVAAYPTISRMVAAGSVAEAYGVLSHAVRLMLFATFAAQVCMTLAGFEVSYLVWGFLSSRFSVADAQAIAAILAFLCVGLGGWAAQSVISRGFYALGSTWLPTMVGTAVAFGMVPFYVFLRQRWGATGLAIASAVAIIIYVLLLGWLQHRRFKLEAAARGATLEHVPGMLDAALRLTVAAAAAIGVGLVVRALLMQFLPGVQLTVLLLRMTFLCSVGTGIYLALARLLGVSELAKIQAMLLPKLGWGRRTR
jgi:putative peptidoglycan lipid II flippase